MRGGGGLNIILYPVPAIASSGHDHGCEGAVQFRFENISQCCVYLTKNMFSDKNYLRSCTVLYVM
jgi:hypothetical protein